MSSGQWTVSSKDDGKLITIHYSLSTTLPATNYSLPTTTDYRVQKMKWANKDKKDTLIYNSKIRIEGILPEVHEYVVNGRSARVQAAQARHDTPTGVSLGWVMERYQVKTDKDSSITNDPNDVLPP